jgi:hypothetical protein
MPKPKSSHEERMRTWGAERLVGPTNWILSRGIFVGCLFFTLRIAAEAIVPFTSSEHVSNYKIVSTLILSVPFGLILAFLRWRAREREYVADAAKRVSETEPNKLPQPTPGSDTPAASAPVAPPSGAAGR